jgi:hypothetical protein
MRDQLDNYFIRISCLILLAYTAILLVPHVSHHLIGSDGAQYYSYMRSFILDHDADITNDIALYNERLPETIPKLNPSYCFSIGPALLWAPFFILGHAAVFVLNTLGFAITADGFSYVEEGLVCCASVLYVIAGVFFLYRMLQNMFSPSTALRAASAVFFASSIFYYTLFEPSMSHGLEFFTTALFLWLALTNHHQTAGRWLFIGLAAGLVAIVRWQNILLLPVLFFLPGDLWHKKQSGQPGNPGSSAAAKAAMLLCGFFFLACLQMLFWKATLGAYLTVPQGDAFLHVARPEVLNVLFSTRNGFISWTPIVLPALIGLFFLRDKKLMAGLLLVVVLDIYVCSIVEDWWAGHAYGMRRLTGILPVITIGFAALLARCATAGKRKAAALFIAACSVWNMLFAAQYWLGFIPHGDYLTFDQMVTDKFLLPGMIISKISTLL